MRPLALFDTLTAGPDTDTAREAVFSFADLSHRAKERARAEHRESGLDDDWWDSIFAEVDAFARMMGILIANVTQRSSTGKVFNSTAAIYFSGFCSQGDGACFTGDWRPVKDPLASLSAVMAHAPNDAELHEIAFALAYMSERCNALIPDACVTIARGRSSYWHEHSVQIDADLPTPDHVDEGNELHLMVWNALVAKHGLEQESFEKEATDALRRFMKWICRQLEAEHDHLMSDEYVDEQLADFTFDEDGNTAG